MEELTKSLDLRICLNDSATNGCKDHEMVANERLIE